MIGSRWSMGARLTLWYSLVLLAGLVLFGGGIWIVVTHSLNAAIDESLTAQMKGVATVLQTEYNPRKPEHLREELSEYADATPEGNLIEVRDGSGNVLLGSPAVSGVEASKGAYRTLARDVTLGGRSYHIVVAAPLEGTTTTLRHVRALLLWATPLVLLLASLGGYWISRRALRPVDAITQ